MGMHISEVFPATFKGEPAQVRVVRSDGYCWGRLVTKTEEFDISTSRDYYDAPDEDAAEAFIRAVKRGKVESIVSTSPIGWAE